jgi:hypothetical protein
VRHFVVTTRHGESTVKVPKGKTLADVGYPDSVIKKAVEVSRPPRDHERLCPKKRQWVRDEKQVAEEDLKRRGRALGRGGLLARIEKLEEDFATLKSSLAK